MSIMPAPFLSSLLNRIEHVVDKMKKNVDYIGLLCSTEFKRPASVLEGKEMRRSAHL